MPTTLAPDPDTRTTTASDDGAAVTPARPVSQLTRQVPAVAAVLAALLAASAWLGWLLHSPTLTKWASSMPAMAPNTAVALLLSAIALWLQRGVDLAPLPNSPGRWVARIAASAVFLFGVIKLGEYGLARSLGFNNLIFRVPAADITSNSPARMAAHTALSFALLGPALLLLGANSRRLWRIAPWIALVPGLIGAASLIGHWYGLVFSLHGHALLDRMALNTAVALVALGLGVVCVRPGEQPILLLRDRGAAGRSLRRLLPVALTIPFLLGWLEDAGVKSGLWGVALGDALVAVFSSLLLAGFIWQSARSTFAAEQRVRQANAALEKEVQTRTAQLRTVNDQLRADADARVATEQELAASEERFRTAFAHAAIGMALTDLDGRYLQVNAAYSRICGYSAEELKRLDFGSVSHPDDMPEKRRLLRELLSGQRPSFVIEKRYVKKTGEHVWVQNSISLIRDAQGRPANIIALTEDITARRRVEEKLQVSEERQRLALGAAQLGTFYCPVPLKTIIWNEQCKAHFWLPPDAEVDFDRFYSILHPDDREPTRQAIALALEQRSTYDVEYRTMAPDGSGRTRWIRAIGRGYYREDNGELTRFDGVTIDVTERRRAEEERLELLEREQALRQAAEGANRVKDEFLATLSHELRTPLNAILGWAHLLRDSAESGDQETWSSGLEVIERNAKAQVQLIEDLLDVSRIITGKLRLDVRPVDLEEVVRSALDSVRPAAEARGVRLQPLLNPRAGPINGDPDRLQQIVWNLLSNAIKFTPRGGRVQVRLERVNSHVEIVVSDTGSGIAAEFLPFLFDRFRQADSSTTRRHGGLGLGLAIVRHLVEMHGGTVEAASPGLDQGTTLTVRLPLLIVHDIRSSGSGGGSGGAAAAALDAHPVKDWRHAMAAAPGNGGSATGDANFQQDDDPVESHGATARSENGVPVAAPGEIVSAAGDGESTAPADSQVPLSKTGITRRIAPYTRYRLDDLRVLAVDDDRDALDLLDAVLTRAGARVFLARNAAEALVFFAPDVPRSRRPDVLISDIGMPEEDGYSLIAKLRALGPACGGTLPAVALTAHARAEDRLRALAAGFDIQATKPIDPAELVLIVARLRERLGAEQLLQQRTAHLRPQPQPPARG